MRIETGKRKKGGKESSETIVDRRDHSTSLRHSMRGARGLVYAGSLAVVSASLSLCHRPAMLQRCPLAAGRPSHNDGWCVLELAVEHNGSCT